MKTNEFIGHIVDFGYEYSYFRNIGSRDVISVEQNKRVLLTVNIKEANQLNSNYGTEIPTGLFDLAVEYARTPVSEREKKPEYYLRSRAPFIIEGWGYLNWELFGKKGNIADKTEDFLTHATKAEWEEMTGYTWTELMQWFKEEPYL